MFKLDSRLQNDTVVVGSFPLCLLLLNKDANYPWFILVPQLEELTEIHHLSEEQQVQFLNESCLLAEAITDVFDPDKLNIAALGNVVPQLHIHHIARFTKDPAWPAPIWNKVPAIDYAKEQLEQRLKRIRTALEGKQFKSA